MSLFDTEYKKLRALNLIIMLMIMLMALGQLAQSWGLYRLITDQTRLIEIIRQSNANSSMLVEILKKRPAAPKGLYYHVEPQKPPGVPTIEVPTASPGKPL